jgi:hypothetical protein
MLLPDLSFGFGRSALLFRLYAPLDPRAAIVRHACWLQLKRFPFESPNEPSAIPRRQIRFESHCYPPLPRTPARIHFRLKE